MRDFCDKFCGLYYGFKLVFAVFVGLFFLIFWCFVCFCWFDEVDVLTTIWRASESALWHMRRTGDGWIHPNRTVLSITCSMNQESFTPKWESSKGQRNDLVSSVCNISQHADYLRRRRGQSSTSTKKRTIACRQLPCRALEGIKMPRDSSYHWGLYENYWHDWLSSKCQVSCCILTPSQRKSFSEETHRGREEEHINVLLGLFRSTFLPQPDSKSFRFRVKIIL